MTTQTDIGNSEQVRKIADQVDLPADLHGRTFTVHRKTGGVTVHGEAATDSIAFSVVTAGGAGQYAILRFARGMQ